MFYLNVPYRWACLQNEGLEGAIFFPTAQTKKFSLERAKDGWPEHVLFDPQLYLLDDSINPAEYKKMLSKISTYEWFGIPPFKVSDDTDEDLDESDSVAEVEEIDVLEAWKKRVSPEKNWAKVVREVVEFQIEFGATAILLPATLFSNPESDLESEMESLEVAIRVAKDLTDLPLYASLPLNVSFVEHQSIKNSQLLEALVDGITAKNGLTGIYIILANDSPGESRITNSNALSAILALTYLFKELGKLDVIVNFLESFGLACLAFGASAYASGYSQKRRAFCLQDYKDRKGGKSYPKFFSLRLIMDFRPERDLERMQSKKLIRLIRSDITTYSKSLIQALLEGKSSRAVLDWEDRANNTAAAEKHYVEVQQNKVKKGNNSREQIVEWLQSAEAQASFIDSQFANETSLEVSRAHCGAWRIAVESVVSDLNIDED